MGDSQVGPAGDTQLAQYGDRADINELGERMRRFLPHGDKMQGDEALAFAQASLALDLNPFAGEIWYIPRVGIVTGIAGYRKMARRQGRFVAELRLMMPDERELHNLADGDLGAVCELYRPDQILDAVAVNQAAGQLVIPIRPVIGIGIWRVKELATKSGRLKQAPTGRSWRWIAEKRAEADALRKAFDLTISFSDREVHVIDGKMIQEDNEPLPHWAMDALNGPRPIPDQKELERKRALLHGADEDADWDAPKLKDPPAEEPEPEEPALELGEAHQAEQMARVARSASPALPTQWTPFAQLAIEKLGYENRDHVSATLMAQGVTPPICTVEGELQFDPLDGWALLKDQAPQPRPQQAKMAV